MLLIAEVTFAAANALLTREIFGNIPPWAKTAFYIVATLSVAAWAFGIWRRVRLWRLGRPSETPLSARLIVTRLVRDVLLQGRFRGRPVASLAHVLLFSGFVVLLIGTTLVSIEHVLADLLGRHANDPVFHKGFYFGVYELLTDTFGLAFLSGCFLFLIRRLRGVGSFAKTPADVGILVLLIAIGITGYIVEGLRIVQAETPLPGLSPVGYLSAVFFRSLGIQTAGAAKIHFALWWVHAILALGFIACIPYSRLLHSLAGTVNLAISDHKLGTMSLIPLSQVEETGQIGVTTLADFSQLQLVELDACVSCGRCEDACPAFEAGKPLSPRNVVQDLFRGINSSGVTTNVHSELIDAETLWSCTTCGACPTVCPLGVSPMRMITDMRRSLIAEGGLRGSPATVLQKTARVGNPWGLSAGDRMNWARGLDVPVASVDSQFEILYWVGCAAAYDPRVQKIARSVVRLLKHAEVNFAVLGSKEKCTGETARRMGDELLFQELAEQNVATLTQHRVRRIVAHCPHCLNSLRNDYPQVGGNYEVVHHSQLLAELVAAGRLQAVDNNGEPQSITYHDPCYLARNSGIVAEPRAVLGSAAYKSYDRRDLPIIELPRNREQTSCCGGGGGRMWFDDQPANRIGQSRVKEIAATGADIVAVSCPFCMIMLGDGMAAEKPEMRVRDIAEILAESVLGPESSSQ